MIKSIYRSPYFLSFLFIVALCIIIPWNIDKYHFNNSDWTYEKLSSDEHLVAYDLDYDGTSELIKFKINNQLQPAFAICNTHGEAIDQWNFVGEFHPSWNWFGFGDCNNNGFTNDSIFLNITEPLDSASDLNQRIHLVNLRKGMLLSDLTIRFHGVRDMNQDGDYVSGVVLDSKCNNIIKIKLDKRVAVVGLQHSHVVGNKRLYHRFWNCYW